MVRRLRWFAAFLIVAAVSRPAAAVETPSPSLTAVQLNNLGVAYMNQQNFEAAARYFSAAHQKDASLQVALLNEGIALLNMQRLPDAKEALEAVVRRDPANVAGWYNLGLVSRGTNDIQGTVQDFSHAVQLAPDSADAHYLLGASYMESGDSTKAVAEFQRALALNPNHASAEFGLARAEEHTGNPAAAKVAFQRFRKITSEKIGSPMTRAYGEMGPLSMAQSIRVAPPAAGPMIPVHFTIHPLAPSPAAAASKSGDGQAGSGGCLLDVDGDGRLDVIAMESGEQAIAVYRNLGNAQFQSVPAATYGLNVTGDGMACTAGDFDNDNRTDLAVSLKDRVLLFRNLGHGKFADVTQSAGIRALNQPAGLTFVDFDHDGDLDLFVTGKPLPGAPSANVLWRNDGNGKFTEWTGPTALGGTSATSNAMLSDLNNDRAVDLLVTGESAPTFYANPREGRFRASPLYTAPGLPGTAGVTALDFNKDGWMDVALTHTGSPAVTLWRNQDGKQFVRVPLPVSGATRGWGIAPIDFDNDGWIDLAVLVDTPKGSQIRILRNLGPRGFADVTQQVGLSDATFGSARSLLVGDLDGDGDADLIVTRRYGSPILLRNDGGNRNHWLRLTLHGLADNKSAIGTKLEIYAGALWQKWEISGASGYMGQSAPEILAGLGTESRVDIVRMLWPTGVLQDELNIAANQAHTIQELDRRGSSCPTLFAWDGTHYRFVSDVIGAAVVGHWTSPTTTNIPDADEWIKIDGAHFKPRGGFLSVRFGEPMEEVNYIDQLRLVAVDHPAGTEVYPNERFLSEPPFVAARTIVASQPRPLAAAWDNTGRNVLPLLAHPDHQYVRDFTVLPYAGFTSPHTLTFDIGPWTPGHPLHLLLTGYIEYFSASSMYSAWQAGLKPQPPVLQAQMPDGSWKTILKDMGFPAGLPRTITVDLTGKLPAGVQRLRMRTNLQIYWDQIAIDNGPDLSRAVRESEVPLAASTLEFRGYPQQIEGRTPGDLTYRYDSVSQTGPFAHQRGQYTRYGRVTPLLKKVDDRFVIFGTGEDLDAEFDARALPPLPANWRRDYFFYANGFVKDMDFHEAAPFSVGEMPFHGMPGYPYAASPGQRLTPQNLRYQLQWNGRFNSGESPQTYRFDYKPKGAAPMTPAPAATSGGQSAMGTRAGQ
jgi:tetratricopeptide (TPR) repeat protein